MVALLPLSGTERSILDVLAHGLFIVTFLLPRNLNCSCTCTVWNLCQTRQSVKNVLIVGVS